ALEFATRATWRETRAMLRTSFPVALYATEATYEIPFGHIRRPTHRNTTWDLARDEVAGHKWVDVSQRDYGVALLNDAKYGHKIKGHVIDLNLIRSVPYPGPRLVQDREVLPGQPHPGYTDQTDHVFRYALYPHPGDHVDGRVAQAGYEFNLPLRVLATDRHPGSAPARQAYLQVDSPHVLVETVKQAEAGAGWIIRLYEANGVIAHTTMQLPPAARQVEETNALEDPLRPLPIQDGQVALVLRPFEIKTLRIGFAA
ncbi:MAG TPA: glycoside hydrolase family 38 C-terminal domain-containing protein, partial [Chloroflexia bacterium]|nr:glycoside hydrolase family 38 C-terminal domain-containing protein [Chloroflexia bacterium]